MKTFINLIACFVLLLLFSSEAVAQGFKLPWNSGTSYYVSRTGTPAPTGSTGSTCGPNSAYNGFNPHGYVAIDFDSPNGVYDPVRAAKAGTVVFAGISGSLTSGYGRLVRIRHSDNTQTYYAHNQAIYVTVGQVVQQGCLIADGGNTGNSFGDHIHFEWKDAGGVAFSDKRYPTFTECGCKVKPRYCYKSTNTSGSCSGTPCTAPSNDNCSSATTITSNGATLTGTVKCATPSYGANTCTGCNCTSPDDLDVYYKFVAQATSHKVTLSNYASNFDGVIELRSGCGSGTNISCYDPSGTPSSVVKTFSGLTIGQTYYVRIFEWDNSGTPPSSPTFKVKVTHTCTAPSNDNCSSATTITSNGATLTGTVKCATGSLGANTCTGCNCVSPDDLDVYYKFVAQATSHKVTLSNYASNFDGVIELRSGCGTGTNISCYDPSGTPSSVVKTFSGLTIGQTYYIRIFEWDNLGTPPSSPTFKVKVTHVCTLPSTITASSFSGATTACSSTSQTYSVLPVTGATSYTWTLPSGWTGSSTTNSISANVGTAGGQVKVKANNACGSSNLQTKQVSVNNAPATPGAISGSNTACENGSQSYSISPVSGATSYTWTLPSGWTGSSTSASINATVGSASGQVTVKANNSCGGSSVKTLQVGVSNSPAMPGAINGATSLCELSPRTYSISPVSGASSYTWTLPSGWTGTSTTTLMTTTPTSTGGLITVKANSSCGSGPDRTLQVDVVNIDNTVAVNNLELTSNATGVSYQWMDCSNMQPIIGETAQVFNPTQNGNYAVIISQGNCIDTSACYQITTLGLSFADQTINLVAYPNPTSDQIVISANGLTNEKHRIVFRNTQGQILIDQEFKVTNQTIDTQFDMSTFPSGLYFMTISSENLKHVFKIEKL